MTRGAVSRLRTFAVAVAYLATFTTLIFNPVLVRADATIAYSGGTVNGFVMDTILLPGITVGGTDPTIPIRLSVDEGILSMTTTTGLAFSGPSTGRNISFSGSVTDINNALATLQYRSVNTGTVTVTATVLPAGSIYSPLNGHIYEVVDNGSTLDWYTALSLASMRTMNGADGYLATVTTQAEYDYLLGRLAGSGWFGASDETTEGDWQWVNGPEVGTSFWAGQGDGSAVGGLFSNWASGEPNDMAGEDCAQFYSDGTGWNDLPCTFTGLQYYIVEYGAPSDLPTPPESVSFNINLTEPTPQNITIDSCLDLIDIYNNGNDNRYDNISLTTDIDCTGETLTPLFDQDDTDFGMVGFRGDFNGNGYTISNVSVIHPSNFGVGLFAASHEATFRNVSLTGEVTGSSCVGGLTGIATNSEFTSISTDMTVAGDVNVGGIVGCLYSEGSGTSSVTDSSSSSTINTTNESAGGIIGQIDSEDQPTISVADNTFDGVLDTVSNHNGGIIGSYFVRDETEATIRSNTVTSDIGSSLVDNVGGIIGYAETYNSSQTIIESNAIEAITIMGGRSVGGVIGEAYNYGADDERFTIRNQTVKADVTSSDSDSVGGIVGYAEDIYLESTFVDATITGADDEVGGLIGESYDSTIIESASMGTVTGDDSFVGGLVGRNSQSIISRSFSLADVTGDDRVGGLVGANGGVISDSYARGTVTGNDQVGGLAGRCGREINRSYATGLVTGNTNVGGFIGTSDGCNVNDSFWDTETTGQLTSDGDETGKTTAEMTVLITFTDTSTVGLSDAWDFDTVWGMYSDENNGYPCLQWQGSDCELSVADASDNDGIATEIEDAAPNNGDANNDGTPDSEQAHVSSFNNPVTNTYTVVQTDSTCSLANVSVDNEASKPVKDSGFDYRSGLVRFTASCGTPGYTATVRVIVFEKDPLGLVLRKYNPNTNAYFTITGASLTTSVIGGRSAVTATYQIVDGGVLDTDGAVNGTIIDPVGLASQVVSVPNTGFAR